MGDRDAGRQRDPLLRRIELPLAAIFHPYAVATEVTSNSQRLMQIATQSWDRFPARAPSPPVLHIRLILHEIDASDDATGSPRRPTFRAAGHLFGVVAGPGGLAVGDSLAGHCSVYVTAQLLAVPGFVRQHLVEGALMMLLPDQGLIPLHGACVSYAGRSLVLRGPGGAGKSTLTCACLRAGWATLGDEVTWLDTRGGRLILRGAPWTLSLPPDSAALYPETHNLPPSSTPSGEPKVDVDVASLWPAACLTESDPGPIVFLQPHAPRVELEPLPLHDARSMLAATLIDGEMALREPTRFWNAAHRLLDLGGAYVLAMTDDPEAAVDALRRLVMPRSRHG